MISKIQENSSFMLGGSSSELRHRLPRLQEEATFYCTHVGNSMNPTLLTSDILEIIRYGNMSLNVGDVIFFLPNGESSPVVHRISQINHDEGIRTRGDKNSKNDPWLLQPEDVFGRVVAAWRGQKRRAIASGKTGTLIYSFSRIKRIVDRTLSSAFGPLYHFLSLRGIVQSLLPNRFKPRIIAFQINGKKQLKLMMNCQQVGYYDTQQKRWHIRRPFRLFVDAYTLTTPNQLNFK